MRIKDPVNKNYCAVVVSIKNIIPLSNCDNVVHTSIFGNLVIVSKDVKIGDLGLFFPVETKLSPEFLSYNNLYRKPELNVDKEKKGYFEENGRIRCAKFRQNKSEGFWIPIESLKNIPSPAIYEDVDNNRFIEGTEFDELNGIKICEKYVVVRNDSTSRSGQKRKEYLNRFNLLIENQFHFHEDTSQLGRNLHKLDSNGKDLISLTLKMHGTSSISSKILCNKKLNILEKILKRVGVNIVDKEYRDLYASRRVIKNQFVYNDKTPKKPTDFYSEDIWKRAHDRLLPILQNNMTIYYEIVGYLGDNSYIQKGYDYGCNQGQFEIYVYRITFTNIDGKVFEYSMKQVQDWCKENGIKAVPLLYYGFAYKVFDWIEQGYSEEYDSSKEFSENLLEKLKKDYLEGNELMNISCVVPREGIVLRIEKSGIEAYKLKSTKFLEHETKELDTGITNIEDDQTIEE